MRTVSSSNHNHCSDLNTNVRSSGVFNHHLLHQDEYETLYVIRHIYYAYRRALQGVTFQVLHLRPIAFLDGRLLQSHCVHTGLLCAGFHCQILGSLEVQQSYFSNRGNYEGLARPFRSLRVSPRRFPCRIIQSTLRLLPQLGVYYYS